MITKERLQEIKGSIVHDRKYKAVIDWDAEGLVDELFDFIDELIAAYEQAQAELAEAEERDDAMDIIGVADKRTIADLRKEVKRLKATNRGE